jgi:hypothetical protein
MADSVIYVPNRVREWVEMADRLHEKKNWFPHYWVAPDYLREDVDKAFADSIFHSAFDARRSIPAETFGDTTLRPLDSAILHRYQPYEHFALRMMDRMDVGNGFDFDERVRHYHRQLRYWRTVIEEVGPFLAVFANTPHTVAEYVLYAVCVESGVETAIFTPTKLPGEPPNYRYLRRRAHDVSAALKENYQRRPPESIELSKSCEQYLNEISMGTTEDSTLHTGGGGDTRPVLRRLKKLLQIGQYPRYLRVLFTEWEQTSRKNPKELPENSRIIGYQNQLYKIKSYFYKRRLANHYEHLSGAPPFDGPFVYFPLHYQPERATLPKGGRYNDQYLVAELLTQEIPSDWQVYIKEHPAQFSASGHGEQGRSTYDYDDLTALDNVKLISSTHPSVNLIDHAEVVATVTGTAGWEAINRGTPAIIFGNAWYRVCGGAHHVKDRTDLHETMTALRDGEIRIDGSEARQFADAVEEVGYRVPMTKPETNQLDSAKTVDRYVQALTEFVER